MGLHVTLTGLRGAIAPFLGILLYAGWQRGGFLPGAWDGIGPWIFGAAGTSLAASQVGVSTVFIGP